MSYSANDFPMQMRGFGDVTVPVATQRKLSTPVVIGLGALVIVGGILIFGPEKRMRPNAARRKKKRKAGQRRRGGNAYRKGDSKKTYTYWAKIIHRDLDAGWLTPEQVSESLAEQYDKDSDQYRREGIRNAGQFQRGVRAAM